MAFGILKAGLVVAPLDETCSKEEISVAARNLGLSYCLTAGVQVENSDIDVLTKLSQIQLFDVHNIYRKQVSEQVSSLDIRQTLTITGVKSGEQVSDLDIRQTFVQCPDLTPTFVETRSGSVPSPLKNCFIMLSKMQADQKETINQKAMIYCCYELARKVTLDSETVLDFSAFKRSSLLPSLALTPLLFGCSIQA